MECLARLVPFHDGRCAFLGGKLAFESNTRSVRLDAVQLDVRPTTQTNGEARDRTINHPLWRYTAAIGDRPPSTLSRNSTHYLRANAYTTAAVCAARCIPSCRASAGRRPQIAPPRFISRWCYFRAGTVQPVPLTVWLGSARTRTNKGLDLRKKRLLGRNCFGIRAAF